MAIFVHDSMSAFQMHVDWKTTIGIAQLKVWPGNFALVKLVLKAILQRSYSTLFWSLFSLTTTDKLKLDSAHNFTEKVGELLFLIYHGMAAIVLLNTLIAMMSSSFKDIESHADMEWKFSRSKLWMDYFDEGSTLPSPFNLIISPKSLHNAIIKLKELVTECIRRANLKCLKFVKDPLKQTTQSSPFKDNTNSMRKNKEQHERYQSIMRRLIRRYIHNAKKKSRQDGVNADDLMEIKQDISSLRFELREGRKHQVTKTSGLMDNFHKDVCSSMTSPTHAKPTDQHNQASMYHHSTSDFRQSRTHGDHNLALKNLPNHWRSMNNLSISSNILQKEDEECSGCYKAVSSRGDTTPLDSLKEDIIFGVRQEFAKALKYANSSNVAMSSETTSRQLMMSSPDSNTPPPQTYEMMSTRSLPLDVSELYTTHLYTPL